MTGGDHDDERQARVERFRIIWDGNLGSISGYVLRRVPSPEDAADCIAETFSVAWRRLDDVPDGARALHWLYGVARRVIANHRRGDRRRADLTSRLAVDLRHTLRQAQTQAVEPAEAALAAATALETLRQEDREILRLASWEGLDPVAVGDVLGCTPGAARVRLHRARARLHAALDEAGSAAPSPSDHPEPAAVEQTGAQAP